MQRKRIRHLLVMEGDRLVGIVTELLYGHPRARPPSRSQSGRPQK